MRRHTTAQALVEFLAAQHTERDGIERRFIPWTLGIFGHGNVAGVGQALQQAATRMPFMLVRNEQAMVHMSAGFAKMANRLQTLACTSSVGPGATNMVTGAAGATINRVPVLLLPGDVFANRSVNPVLQQLEHPLSPDISVNDAFGPVCRFFDRINRPEQLLSSALEAVRVLTNPAETGAATLALPEDVQAEAWDFPEEFFLKRVWRVGRPAPEAEMVHKAADLIRSAKKPFVIAGGGVLYSEASAALQAFARATGIPVGETQAGKGSLPYDHPSSLGAVGATGTLAANGFACKADLVIGIGTRYSDFTTASRTAFQNPDVRFVNVNIGAADAAKHAGLGLVGDARATLDALGKALRGFAVDPSYRAAAATASREWDVEVARLYSLGHGPLPAQSEVLGAVNELSDPRDVVVCAAGSAPGDLHKLWRTRDPKGYHVEYGYSCMGYEIPGGLGVRLAAPDRDVFVIVGDGSWLMMCTELVTAVQEGIKVIVVLMDNGGFASIGGLSASLGSAGFGTFYRRRGSDGQLSAAPVAVNFESNARSLGVHTVRADTIPALRAAITEAKARAEASVVVIRTDREARVPGYEGWWDVPPAEVSEMPTVRAARKDYEQSRKKKRHLI
jgi:3D-(3,5/4)-trihydroxycyclohexane-1,2-dione acylhydrolase (decyclizing)